MGRPRSRPVLAVAFPFRVLWLLLFLCGGGWTAARGQEAEVKAAIRLTHFNRLDDGRWFYHYRIVGQPGGRISDVYLDISQPPDGSRPRILGTRGDFLFDALAEQYSSSPISHPPLGIASPEHWSAAIYIQGVLSWGAERYERGSNWSVPDDFSLTGFELQSPAVPAFRRFQAVPYTPLSAQPEAGARPSSMVLYRGITLAPGWEPRHITASYLLDQVNLACEAVLLDECGRYLLFVDPLVEAEARKDVRAFRNAVMLFERHLGRDQVSHINARFVLTETLKALQSRADSWEDQQNLEKSPGPVD